MNETSSREVATAAKRKDPSLCDLAIFARSRYEIDRAGVQLAAVELDWLG